MLTFGVFFFLRRHTLVDVGGCCLPLALQPGTATAPRQRSELGPERPGRTCPHAGGRN